MSTSGEQATDTERGTLTIPAYARPVGISPTTARARASTSEIAGMIRVVRQIRASRSVLEERPREQAARSGR